MKREFLLFAFLISLISMNTEAQHQSKLDSLTFSLETQTDSLKIYTYGEMLSLVLDSDTIAAQTILAAQWDVAKNMDVPKLMALAKRDEARFYFEQANYREAKKLLKEGEELFLQAKDSIGFANILDDLSKIAFYEGEVNRAQELALFAIQIKERLNASDSELIKGYISLGNYQSNTRRYETSLKYYRMANTLAIRTSDSTMIAKSNHMLGINMQWLGRYGEAIDYLRTSMAFNKKLGKDKDWVKTLNSLGFTYFKMDSLTKAKQIFKQALSLNQATNDRINQLYNYTNLGEVSLREKAPKEAIENFSKAIEIMKETNRMVYIHFNYKKLSDAYAMLNNYERAYHFRTLHQNLKDSIYSKENIEKLNKLELKYETEKKQAALALQGEEIKTLNEKVKVDKLTKGLYGGGALAGLALSGLLFFVFRQRIKKNKLAREKQEVIYKQEIAFKKKELASQTLHLVQKNTFLQELKENLESLKSSPEKFKIEFRRIVMLLKKESTTDKDWNVFKSYFSEVHDNFDNKLKAIYQDISEKDLRLASFIKMNLSTKEIAALLNVLPQSVLTSKYRLKKKLGIPKDTDIYHFLMDIT